MSQPIQILVASNNSHKHLEIAQILDLLGVSAQLCKPLDYGIEIDPIENAPTYEGNAQIKAHAFWNAFHSSLHAQRHATKLFVLADDSGLEVDALDGRPGLYSARYANAAPNGDGCGEILRELQTVHMRNRQARFRAAIKVIAPDEKEYASEGVIEGTIAHDARGTNGFGYDPIFIPVGDQKHLAELTDFEKHRISHRGLAIAKLVPILRDQTSANCGA